MIHIYIYCVSTVPKKTFLHSHIQSSPLLDNEISRRQTKGPRMSETQAPGSRYHYNVKKSSFVLRLGVNKADSVKDTVRAKAHRLMGKY